MPATASASPKQAPSEIKKPSGKPSIGDMSVDELYQNYLYGQRAMFGAGDFILGRGLLDFVEAELKIVGDVHDGAPRATIMHRYMKGELTDGIIPWEIGTIANEMREACILGFFTVLEVLRMKADGSAPSFEVTEKTFVRGKRNRLAEGMLGPFVFTRVRSEPVVMCWACKAVHGLDIVMALGEKPSCPECGAKSTGPTEKVSEGKDAQAPATKPRRD